MKILILMFCLVCSGIVIKAQSATASGESPSLAIVKFGWTKERTNWQQDPFSGPIENFDEMRVRARNEKRIQEAKKGGIGAEISRAERDARTDEALTAQIHLNKPGRYQFSYSLEVRNSGSRTIQAIDWDYVFFDLNDRSELGRRQFRSEEKIEPGKSKELRYFSAIAPTKTVSITSLDKNERANLGEAIIVVRVEYRDGSVWQLH